MNSVANPGRKTALCRYFASSGSCFYGDDCQFLHENPRLTRKENLVGDNLKATNNEQVGGNDGDQYFTATFNSNDAPPQYSRAAFVMRGAKQGGVPRGPPLPPNLIDNNKAFLPPNPVAHLPGGSMDDSALQEQFATMNLAGQQPPPWANYRTPLKVGNMMGRNPEASEFVPKSGGSSGGVGLTHSASTPSFTTNYAQLAAMGASPNMPPPPLPQGGLAFSAGTSPMDSPGMSPQGSPMSMRRNHGNHSPMTPGMANSTPPNMGGAGGLQEMGDLQENIGGTTFFYSQEDLAAQHNGVILPNFTMYPSILPHVAHMKPKANMPGFFMPDEIKLEILNRHALSLAQIDTEQNPDIPQEVDNYHCLFPLEPPPASPLQKSCTFGYPTTCYKAVNTKDGLTYCLRRIHGFRLVNHKCMALIDLWKKIQHSNIVGLREVFTTKAFGDHSMVFVYDFHPGSETMMARHFMHNNHMPNGYANPYNLDGAPRPYSAGKGRSQSGANGPRGAQPLLAESVIWSYIVQLTSALRTIHTHGLACRVMDPTKILLTDKTRIRLNCLGIFDVLSFDSNQANQYALMQHYQQEDLVSLGKVVLAVACNSIIGIQQEHLHTSMELITHNYSADLKNLILYLLREQNRMRSVNDIMPMIGARFYTQLDAAQLRNDVLENEVAKEVESSRLFRLLCKLGVINERPEFNMDASWSETGDRYMLKLFRDYLFHQVDENGAPWIDMAHIVQCLNKLDAGSPEKVCLMSRDEQSVLVVTYAELKQCFDSAFNEMLTATVQSGQGPQSAGGSQQYS